MFNKTKVQRPWLIASVALFDAYTDFILSRQAMNCAASALAFSKYTAGGSESLELVQHYAQIVDKDLLQAHKAHSPVDSLR